MAFLLEISIDSQFASGIEAIFIHPTIRVRAISTSFPIIASLLSPPLFLSIAVVVIKDNGNGRKEYSYGVGDLVENIIDSDGIYQIETETNKNGPPETNRNSFRLLFVDEFDQLEQSRALDADKANDSE